MLQNDIDPLNDTMLKRNLKSFAKMEPFMSKPGSLQLAAFEKDLQEFKGLSNEQAYVHVFSKRIMKPIPNRHGEYFGSDQRIDMTPFLKKAVATIPKNGQIFDVGAGAGAGDVVDFALKEAPQNTVINIEDPNSTLLNAYQLKLIGLQLVKKDIPQKGFWQASEPQVIATLTKPLS